MILRTEEFRDKLRMKLNSAREEVIVLSAFLKESALEWILDNTTVQKISIVSRWQPYDLIAKTSDVSCYRFCSERGIRFGISWGLHAKVYCIDRHVLVGSANATGSGLALTSRHNDEFGVCFVGGNAERGKLDEYLRTVTWVDEKLYKQLMDQLSRIPKFTQASTVRWSESIQSELNKADRYIWVHDLPFHTLSELQSSFRTESSAIDHDLELLGITRANFTSERATFAFKNSRAFAWCYDVVRANRSLSFGGLSSILHNSILDDPSPYRREIKELIQILFSWLEFYPSDFQITRPNYSEVITFVGATSNS